MASIRRTLSPYHDRPYQNGSNSNNPFASSSSPSFPSNKLNKSIQSLFSNFFFYSPKNPARKHPHHSSWIKPFYRCLLFFLLGFLLGMAPFNSNTQDIIIPHDFEFPAKNSKVNLEKEFENPRVLTPPRPDGKTENVELQALDSHGDLEEKIDYVPRKQLIVVTPTYNRALQGYFLNRVGQVLRLVKPPVLWIVVEMGVASTETAQVLREIGVMYRHLVCVKNLTDVKDRGVHQRNVALEHIERHRLDGIVYFADDDNVYSLELFERMREISRFGTWPVAMLAQSKNKAILEGPICNGSQVIGWHTNEKSKRLRRFHVDMSGFAFNSTILWDPKRWHRPTSDPIRQLDTVKEGFQETTFIEQVVEDESQMEGVPPGCSRIMNWHLHLEARGLVYPKGWLLQKNLDVSLPSR